MRKIGILAMVLAVMLLTAPIASALVYTDTTTKAGFDIDYTLTWVYVSGTTYSATFTIDPNGTNLAGVDWYASAFTFKFDGATPSEITNVSGGWTITDGNTNQNFSRDGFSRSDGFSGFYKDALAGVLVDGDFAPTVITFDFTLPAGGILNDDIMPFKVGYWSTLEQGNNFGQLSKELDGNQVPEPGTLLLLGGGLVGLALYGRKSFKR